MKIGPPQLPGRETKSVPSWLKENPYGQNGLIIGKMHIRKWSQMHLRIGAHFLIFDRRQRVRPERYSSKSLDLCGHGNDEASAINFCKLGIQYHRSGPLRRFYAEISLRSEIYAITLGKICSSNEL